MTALQRARAELEHGDARLASAWALLSIADSLERLTPAVQSGALAALSMHGGMRGQAILDAIGHMLADPSASSSPSPSSDQSMSSQSMSSTTTGPSVRSPVSWGTAPNSRGGA